MRPEILDILACPRCRLPLVFSGDSTEDRLVDGLLRCSQGHTYQLKKEIPILKAQELSEREFTWVVDFPNIDDYEKVRRKYESYLSRGIVNGDRAMVKEMAKSASSENLVLDIALGMGTLLLALSSEVGEDAHVLGTDVDEKPLRGAKLKLGEQNGYERVSLCVMDGKHLAFKPGELTCVTSHFGFDNIPRPEHSFNEAARVLASRGSLFFSALWLRAGSKSLALAERLGYGSIMTKSRLRRTLEGADFEIESLDEFCSGTWPRNPMDRLPLEGDWFAHVLVKARRN